MAGCSTTSSGSEEIMETRGTPLGRNDEPDRFSAAGAQFRSSLSSILGSPELEHRIAGLFEDYAAVSYEAMQSAGVASRAAERYEPYARAVAVAFAVDASRHDLERAFSTYVGALQQAWTTIDATSLGPTELASIAEGMQWVAGVVGVVRSTAPDE
jgi:hypothetical protein